ncbi:MAG: hypothetical protein ACLFUO_02095 [Candidatus Woesearchaeota archaeon]
MAYDSSEKDVYIDKRIEEFMTYPAEYLGKHARSLFGIYTMDHDAYLPKKKIHWLINYIGSPIFNSCQSLKENKNSINKKHKEALSYIADLEYHMLYETKDQTKQKVTEKTIDDLAQMKGCDFESA